MNKKVSLENKRILIVDDEPDVLDVLEESLAHCKITKASTYKEASQLIEKEVFDIAILDIMGVDGYQLLELANQKKIPSVMLTANAFTLEDTEKSFKNGAALYVPKEKMSDIEIYLQDVLEGIEENKSTWWRWFDRFASYYDQKFERDWKNKEFLRLFPF